MVTKGDMPALVTMIGQQCEHDTLMHVHLTPSQLCVRASNICACFVRCRINCLIYVLMRTQHECQGECVTDLVHGAIDTSSVDAFLGHEGV